MMEELLNYFKANNYTEAEKEDILKKFVPQFSFENKTSDNITSNVTFNKNPCENTTNYCEGDISDFFREYKQYHGYVSLIVSIRMWFTDDA